MKLNTSNALKGGVHPCLYHSDTTNSSKQNERQKVTYSKCDDFRESITKNSEGEHNSRSSPKLEEVSNSSPRILATYRLEALFKHYPLHYHISLSELLPDKNGVNRYLDAHVIMREVQKKKAKAVVLAIGMGAGKTEQFKITLNEYFDGRGAVIAHRTGLVNLSGDRLGIVGYQDIKAAKLAGAIAKALSTTIHSLPILWELESAQSALSGGLIGLDESESIAHEFTNSTIRNESKTLEALQRTADNAGLLMLMDAHAGAGTSALLQNLGYEPNEVLVITADVQELAGYQARLFVEGGEGSPKKAAMMGKILEDLKNGLKVIVTSLSKELLDELEKHIQTRVSGCNFVKVTSDTANSEQVNTLNADTYGDYEAVLISPSMSTGVSFDKDNADTAYVFAVNAPGTGTPYDALQAMLRDRAIKSRCINIYYQSPPIPLKSEHEVMLEDDARNQAIESFVDSLPIEHQQRWEKNRPDSKGTLQFIRKVNIAFAQAKLNFLEILEEELKAKGAEVSKPDISVLDNIELMPEERQAVKEALQEANINRVIESPSVSSIERDILKSPFDNQEKHELTESLGIKTPVDVRATLTKHYIESEVVHKLDDMPAEEARELVESVVDSRGNKNLIHQLREWERARAKPEELKTIRDAALVGVQADDNDEPGFMEKITTDKTKWPDRGKYGGLLLKAVGITFDESGRAVWDGDTLINEQRISWHKDRGFSLFQVMLKPKRFIECGLLPIKTVPLNVKKNKIDHIRKALEHFGVKLRKSRKSNDFHIDEDSMLRLVEMFNARKDAGKDSIKERLTQIQDYLNDAPVREERRAWRFANFVAANVDTKPDTKQSGERMPDNEYLDSLDDLGDLWVSYIVDNDNPDGAALFRELWKRAGRHDDITPFLSEFAADMPEIEAGNYPIDTLFKVVKTWR